MNPNYDEMANPDDTYVDLSFAKDRSDWRLPEQKKTTKRKGSNKKEPVSDTMQNIQLHLNTIPGLGIELPAIEDTPFMGEAVTVDDGFEERPSGPFPMILPGLPSREFRAAGIPDSELAAAQRGRRWHWHNENSFMPPGSEWNKTVWQGADREDGRAVDKFGIGKGITATAGARLKQQDINQWKAFVDGIKQGHYSSQGELNDEAKRFIDEFRPAFAAKWGEDSLALLEPIPTQFGKRSDLARKNLQDIKDNINYTDNILSNIEEWAADGSWSDPVKSQMIKNYMDKVSQALSAQLGGDSKSMADAEKVRIQILYLPEQSLDLVKEEMRRYNAFLSSVMAYGRSKGWSQNIIGKINRVKDAYADAAKANGKANVSTLAAEATSMASDLLPSLSPSDKETALGLESALQAGKEAHDMYMQNMVLAADVDPSLVYQFADVLRDNYTRNYNSRLKDYERSEVIKGRDKSKAPSLGDLSRVVKPSSFLTPVNYMNLLVEHSRPETGKQNPQDFISQLSKYGLTAEDISVLNGQLLNTDDAGIDIKDVELR
jgi:hypothetical protein